MQKIDQQDNKRGAVRLCRFPHAGKEPSRCAAQADACHWCVSETVDQGMGRLSVVSDESFK
ncbi:hypothetical protein, partial [Pseudomonas helleri]|uniref:hypothetical protein n=1 Tax=Pseudomonas helleri TaxID=1608996 RepID=UPI001885DDA6